MDTEWISFCILSQECKNIFPLQTHHTRVFILELPLQLRQQTTCQYDNSFLLCTYPYSKGHFDIVKALITEGYCDANIRNSSGDTLLHVACR